ncbi:MAG: toll/interleukin-1 receptor domain-containing protein [Micrococcales bacterium]|nr:toll/interleukin-1 receptor domain-containing protein [Micrococcales bacterium]
MRPLVFISHASPDAMLAAHLVQALETAGLRCWIAPRDIAGGSDYAAEIMGAIRRSQVMVVVVSDNANASQHVKREVERAVSKGLALVPFRIADISPSDTLEYFLSCQHWLHALPPPSRPTSLRSWMPLRRS